MASRRLAIVALVASIGSAMLVVVLYNYGEMLYGSPAIAAENNHATNTFGDHNLQVTVDYTENTDNGIKQSFVLTVKNIGQHDLMLSNVDLAGSRCDLQPTCDGNIPVMDYRMVGIDSALPMNPVYDQGLRLGPGNKASSSVIGSWDHAEKFVAFASYSLATGNPWLDEYTFSVHNGLNFKNSSIASLRESDVADEPIGGVLVQYWRQYEGMPEPKVYVFKSFSLNNTRSAMDEFQKVAKNSIDPRSAVKAIEYDSNATIDIRYMGTALSFPLIGEVVAPTRSTGEAAYVFVLVPEKLTLDKLSFLSSTISAYDFELIGYADRYEAAVNEDNNIQVLLKHKMAIDNGSGNNNDSSDYVEIHIKNIGTKPVVIETANVFAKNIHEQGAFSSKFIYGFIGDGDSFVNSEHKKLIRLEPTQQTIGSAAGNWSEWQYFEGEVKYTVDGQVRVVNRVISDVKRT